MINDVFKELHEEVSCEVELQELDQLFANWNSTAAARNINIQALVNDYIETKSDGETLRNPATERMRRVTYDAQKRTRSMVINQIIYLIAATEIDQIEKAALAKPVFKDLHGEIKGDAEYLRRMLPDPVSMDHPHVAEQRYRSMSNELARLTQKVLSKL